MTTEIAEIWVFFTLFLELSFVIVTFCTYFGIFFVAMWGLTKLWQSIFKVISHI